MTRGLHAQTRVQRGAAGGASGPEPSDAPDGKVALALAGFLVLMLLGMGAAGWLAQVWHLRNPPHAAAEAMPPGPRLLADPRQERLRLESQAERRLQAGPMPIDRAMTQVTHDGWGDRGP